MLFLPFSESGGQFHRPRLNFRGLQPTCDGLNAELKEDALASVFKRRQPGHFSSQRCAPNANVQFTLNVRGSSFESREPKLRNDFAEAMDQNDAFYRLHPWTVPDRTGQCTCMKNSFGPVLANFVFRGK